MYSHVSSLKQMPVVRNIHLRSSSRFKLALTTAIQLATGDLSVDASKQLEETEAAFGFGSCVFILLLLLTLCFLEHCHTISGGKEYILASGLRLK